MQWLRSATALEHCRIEVAAVIGMLVAVGDERARTDNGNFYVGLGSRLYKSQVVYGLVVAKYRTRNLCHVQAL